MFYPQTTEEANLTNTALLCQLRSGVNILGNVKARFQDQSIAPAQTLLVSAELEVPLASVPLVLPWGESTGGGRLMGLESNRKKRLEPETSLPRPKSTVALGVGKIEAIWACPPPPGLLPSIVSGVWTTVLCSQDVREMTCGRLPLSGAEKGKEAI